MSETLGRIINDQLKRRPGARHAYDHDSTMRYDIERARGLLSVVEAAMRREGIPYDSAERVLNEVVHAGLEGWEREKLSRERVLLLADFSSSEGVGKRERELAYGEMLERSLPPVRPDEEPT